MLIAAGVERQPADGASLSDLLPAAIDGAGEGRADRRRLDGSERVAGARGEECGPPCIALLTAGVATPSQQASSDRISEADGHNRKISHAGGPGRRAGPDFDNLMNIPDPREARKRKRAASPQEMNVIVTSRANSVLPLHSKGLPGLRALVALGSCPVPLRHAESRGQGRPPQSPSRPPNPLTHLKRSNGSRRSGSDTCRSTCRNVEPRTPKGRGSDDHQYHDDYDDEDDDDDDYSNNDNDNNNINKDNNNNSSNNNDNNNNNNNNNNNKVDTKGRGGQRVVGRVGSIANARYSQLVKIPCGNSNPSNLERGTEPSVLEHVHSENMSARARGTAGEARTQRRALAAGLHGAHDEHTEITAGVDHFEDFCRSAARTQPTKQSKRQLPTRKTLPRELAKVCPE
jgi:hypothetical protein